MKRPETQHTTADRPRPDLRTALGRARRKLQFLAFHRVVHRALHPLHRVPGGRRWHRRLHASTELSTPEIRLPVGAAGLDGLRLAFLSDAHVGLFTTPADLARLGERLAPAAPDLVCLGGDLIATRPAEARAVRHLLEHLAPPLGTFAVPGNHEHACFGHGRGAPGLAAWEGALEELGVRVLRNRGVRLERGGAGLWLGGVEDDQEGHADVDAALTGRRAGEPAVLLSHQPDVFVRSAERGVDLQLSGHTHGGQVRLFGWAPLSHTRHGFLAGHYARGTAQLYVGRGVGTSMLPLRLGVTPELPVVRLAVGR